MPDMVLVCFSVKQALELLGGKIKVSSEEGKGSYFAWNITFPLAEENLKPSIPQSCTW